MFRYYVVGVVNTVFGYGLFALLVWLSLNLFVAQILAHLSGMAFNYVMFRVHVFRGPKPELRRYIAAYSLNYLLGLASLTVAHSFIASPYIAGLVTLLVISILNYFILKRFVFLSS